MRQGPQNPAQSRNPTWGEGQHPGQILAPDALLRVVEDAVVRMLQVREAAEGHVPVRRIDAPFALQWEAPSGGGLPPGTQGDLLYHDGFDWVVLPRGDDGATLRMVSGIPTWEL
jgi:hypothetical protein